MSDRVAICGMGLLGGFGAGRNAACRALGTGGGPNGAVDLGNMEGAASLPAYIADTTLLEQYLNKRLLRRVNRYSKMALLGACLALEDAGCGIPVASDRVGVIIASGYGALSTTFEFLDSMINDGDALASPLLFSNSVHSSAASHLSILLQISGPCLTISQFELSGVAALMTAYDWLADGAADAVLVGAVEEVNSVMSYCYDRFGESTATGTMGEGACFLLLRRETDAVNAQACLERVACPEGSQLKREPGATLVVGDDGQPCCADYYRSLDPGISFASRYGSLPSGQIFDVAFSVLAQQMGIISGRVQSIKADKEGKWGEILIAPRTAPARETQFMDESHV